MNEHFYNGFIKRAQDYGFTVKQANDTFNRITEFLGFGRETTPPMKALLNLGRGGTGSPAPASPAPTSPAPTSPAPTSPGAPIPKSPAFVRTGPAPTSTGASSPKPGFPKEVYDKGFGALGPINYKDRGFQKLPASAYPPDRGFQRDVPAQNIDPGFDGFKPRPGTLPFQGPSLDAFRPKPGQ